MTAASLQETTDWVAQGSDLDTAAATAAAHALADAAVPREQKKAFLRALAKKGETPVEVAAFAQAYRGLARDPGLGDTSAAIDIVGTGGDKSGSFNISTTTSLILAASGQPVVKHGNRSITSKCGSADFLDALGIALEPSPEKLRGAFETLGFVFLFAPAYHPAFKEVVPVRKELAAEGQRTIFNLLGPLINPGRPGSLLMGVFSPAWVEPLARSLEAMEAESAAVVSSTVGDGVFMDELSCAGENTLAGVGRMSGLPGTLNASDAGLTACSLDDLKGGDMTRNLELLELLMAGKAVAGLTDTVCLNAGLALLISGRAGELKEGIGMAREVLSGGALRNWLQQAKDFFAA